MSRNFEVLKQLELAADVAERPAIPVTDRVVMSELARSREDAPSEEMMGLAQAIFLSTMGGTPRQILFCGVDPVNGSSSVCASAGRALVEVGAKSVCLVDACVRSPQLSRSLGANTTGPFSGKPTSVLEQCILLEDKLWLAGTELLVDDRGSLLPVIGLKQLLKQLRDVFDYVLIDAPAISVSADATIIGQVADAAVLVIEANSTRRLTARRAKDTLESAGVRLMGTVLRNRTFPLPERLFKKL